MDDEYGVSLIGEARVPKRDAEVCGMLLKMYASGQLYFSFEILAGNVEMRDGLQVIDASEENELIGMAVVTIPAYPEASALKLVAEDDAPEDRMENEKGEDESLMDENQKKIAELEAKLKLAEQKNETDEELRKKEEEVEEAQKKCKEAEEQLQAKEAELAQVNASVSAAEQKLTEAQTALSEKDERIAELAAQVTELTPYKAEAETLKAEKAATELAAKQQELTAFAEAQGLDVKAEAVAAAIQAVNYEALIAEAMKQEKKPVTRATVASFAMSGGMPLGGEYGDLLDKA